MLTFSLDPSYVQMEDQTISTYTVRKIRNQVARTKPVAYLLRNCMVSLKTTVHRSFLGNMQKSMEHERMDI